MKVLQLLGVLFLFNLTQKEIQGASDEELYGRFHTVHEYEIASDDLPIYWNGAEPSLEPPPLEASTLQQKVPGSDSNESSISGCSKEPPLKTPMTLKQITKKFVKYHKEKTLQWPQLQNTIQNTIKWDGFCLYMWKRWKTQHEDESLLHLFCSHTTYSENEPSLMIDCSKYTNIIRTFKVDMLGCFCEYRRNLLETSVIPDFSNTFFLSRKDDTAYFLLHKESKSLRARILNITGYITRVDYWNNK